MASPSWSFNSGVISDVNNPGWSYDLSKQTGSGAGLSGALSLAMGDWQSKFDPGRLLMSNDLTAANQGISKQAGDWGSKQTWGISPMGNRTDIAPSQPGFTPSMGAGSSIGANGQILNAQGQPQGTPQRTNALLGGAAADPRIQAYKDAQAKQAQFNQLTASSNPLIPGQPGGAGAVNPAGARPITQSLDELTSPADKLAAANAGRAGAAPGGLPPGFDVRLGSNDPNINHQVYGTNYFPGNLPGFEGIKTKEQFFALTPQQQGDYRVALQKQFQASQQPGQGGTAPAGSQPGLTPEETAQGVIPPRTGPGAGRGYPSNWNSNNNPNLGGDTTFATNPATGASYEVSPMYQFQKEAGEKAINRQLRARGRYNSSVGINALANFNNQLGAMEADKQYNRVFDQQKLGLQAALAQAQSQGASAEQLAELYTRLGGAMGQGSQNYGTSVADLIRIYGVEQARNILSQGGNLAGLAAWQANPQVGLGMAQGANDADFWEKLATIGGQGFIDYMKNRQ